MRQESECETEPYHPVFKLFAAVVNYDECFGFICHSRTKIAQRNDPDHIGHRVISKSHTIVLSYDFLISLFDSLQLKGHDSPIL